MNEKKNWLWKLFDEYLRLTWPLLPLALQWWWKAQQCWYICWWVCLGRVNSWHSWLRVCTSGSICYWNILFQRDTFRCFSCLKTHQSCDCILELNWLTACIYPVNKVCNINTSRWLCTCLRFQEVHCNFFFKIYKMEIGIFFLLLEYYYYFIIPQISKAIAGADRKELMRKLPKFIYDEEKALEVSSCLLLIPSIMFIFL